MSAILWLRGRFTRREALGNHRARCRDEANEPSPSSPDGPASRRSLPVLHLSNDLMTGLWRPMDF
jgi:hypothetical protein